MEMVDKIQLEKDLIHLESDLDRFNELNKKEDMKEGFRLIIEYTKGQINMLRYVLGYYKEIR